MARDSVRNATNGVEHIHLRWYHLMRAIIGGRSGSPVSTELKDDVFSPAEAYAGLGLDPDLKTKPGPGIAVPTFWDFAMNSAVWTIDEFFDRVQVELDALAEVAGADALTCFQGDENTAHVKPRESDPTSRRAVA